MESELKTITNQLISMYAKRAEVLQSLHLTLKAARASTELPGDIVSDFAKLTKKLETRKIEIYDEIIRLENREHEIMKSLERKGIE